MKLQENAFKKIYPLKWMKKFLDKNLRPDGRGFDDQRPQQVQKRCILSADGSALVSQGNTKVLCGIKLEVTTPHMSTPEDGYILVDCQVGPLCSSRFHVGKRRDDETALAEKLRSIILNAKVLNLHELCIEREMFVWVCYVDVLCLSFDGNLFDPSLIAVLAALQDLQIPQTVIKKEEVLITKGTPTRLTIADDLIPLSLECIDGKILADATIEEEDLSKDGFCTVFTKEGGKLVFASKKASRSLLTPEKIKEMIKIAAQIVRSAQT